MTTVHLVKRVAADWTTRGGQSWAVGVTVTIPPKRRGTTLCSKEVLHAYRSVEQALLLDPVHSGYAASGHLLDATSPVVVADDGLKVGVHELTPTAEIERPAWWIDPALRRRVQVRFAAVCARAVLPLWERQCPDDPRPQQAIEAAEAYLAGRGSAHAARAARAAYAARAADAAYAAYAAARAATDATDAARAARAAYAARAADAAYAAYAAARAATDATDAAYAAARAATDATDAAYAAARAATDATDAARAARAAYAARAADAAYAAYAAAQSDWSLDIVALARQAVVEETPQP